MEKLTKAITFYNNKEYEKSYLLFLELANQGSIDAMYYLGIIYNRGFGVELNQEESFKWFLKAANNNHAISQYIVALSYSEDDQSTYVPHKVKNIKEFQIAEQALNQIPPLKLPLPKVESNFKEAMKWCIKAYENNNDSNIRDYILNQLLFDFRIRANYDEVDIEITDKLRDIFIKENNDYYQFEFPIGVTYEKAANYKEAMFWYKEAFGTRGKTLAAIQIGYFYLYGRGVEKNIEKAKNYLELGFYSFGPQLKHYFKGYYYLAKAYQEIGDESNALWYLYKGSDINDGLSEIELRKYYDNGRKIRDKYAKKFEILTKAEKGGLYDKQDFILKYVYENNDGYIWDACKWIINEIELNYNTDMATKLLYSFYTTGKLDFFPEQYKDAKEWLIKQGLKI